jgi:hypothetical protein
MLVVYIPYHSAILALEISRQPASQIRTGTEQYCQALLWLSHAPFYHGYDGRVIGMKVIGSAILEAKPSYIYIAVSCPFYEGQRSVYKPELI